MDFETLFSEYWRKVVAEGDNNLDKKAIARNAFAAGLEIRPTPVAADGANACPECNQFISTLYCPKCRCKTVPLYY